jgi:hypothetical protein
VFSTACQQDSGSEADSSSPEAASPIALAVESPVQEIPFDEDPGDITVTSPPVLRTPTAESTKITEPTLPSVFASRQVLDDDGQVIVDQIVALQDGWVVIYVDDDGRKGAILGFSPIAKGTYESVVVSVDPLQAGDALHIGFHTDEGEIGTFEYPGSDQPLEHEGLLVEDQIRIDNRATIPEISVSDQEILEDGIVTVDYVAATRPGWLGLHIDEGGRPGAMAAYAPVEAGINENLALVVNWREATGQLHAVLYEDSGKSGSFEEESIDQPVKLDGDPITAAFQAIFPPDVHVVNQPVVDGNVLVERAVSYGSGWLVVYFDDEGQIGNIIGQAPLENGINEQIVVPVVASAVTPLLHVLLHQDTDESGEFQFPLADPMVTHQGIVPHPIAFRTDAGNYLITRDQSISQEGEIIIPLIVVEEDAWIVIYTDEEGEAGEQLGLTWIPAGLHRDVSVMVDVEAISSTLHAILHVDLGVGKEFEYPDNPDVPFRRNSNIIDSPFTLWLE